MAIEITSEMSKAEIVDAMIEIGSDEEQARDFLSRFIEVAIAHPNNATRSRCMIVQKVKHNLGYIMGYAPTRIDVKMWKSLGCRHSLGVI